MGRCRRRWIRHSSIARRPHGPDAHSPEASRKTIEEVDQWTIEGGLRSQLPLEKYSWPDGQQVYLNPNTGAVVQYTTTSYRFWAYLGAIPHWLYFTPLRQHQPQWFSLVVWSSLIGTAAALLGVIIAVWMYSPKKPYRHAGAPTSIPYRGWKRWHTITGLAFGVVTATWAFSGLLSMGPFPIVDRLTELTVPIEPRDQTAGPVGDQEAVSPLRSPAGGHFGSKTTRRSHPWLPWPRSATSRPGSSNTSRSTVNRRT